jgi:hypothetical protein
MFVGSLLMLVVSLHMLGAAPFFHSNDRDIAAPLT